MYLDIVKGSSHPLADKINFLNHQCKTLSLHLFTFLRLSNTILLILLGSCLQICFDKAWNTYFDACIPIFGEIIVTMNGFETIRAVHKRRPHKIAKNDSPSPCPQNIRTGLTHPSSPLVQTNTPKIPKNRKFFAPKSADVRIEITPPFSEKCPHWANPP